MPRPPGSGKPKGYKAPQTLDKLAAREFVREKVIASLTSLLDAQIANAQGIKYLVVREKSTGKFSRVPKNAAEKLNPEEEIIEVWEKDPSVQAFTDLLNRTVDKPAEQVQEIEHKGGITIRWQESE